MLSAAVLIQEKGKHKRLYKSANEDTIERLGYDGVANGSIFDPLHSSSHLSMERASI